VLADYQFEAVAERFVRIAQPENESGIALDGSYRFARLP
jgi:hypothetical protein